MAELQRIKVKDPNHVALLAEWYGLLAVKGALEKQPFGQLPGYALALALVSEHTALNLRFCASQGVDIAQVEAVNLVFDGGAPVLEIAYLDLVDMAEGATDAR